METYKLVITTTKGVVYTYRNLEMKDCVDYTMRSTNNPEIFGETKKVIITKNALAK